MQLARHKPLRRVEYRFHRRYGFRIGVWFVLTAVTTVALAGWAVVYANMTLAYGIRPVLAGEIYVVKWKPVVLSDGTELGFVRFFLPTVVLWAGLLWALYKWASRHVCPGSHALHTAGLTPPGKASGQDVNGPAIR